MCGASFPSYMGWCNPQNFIIIYVMTDSFMLYMLGELMMLVVGDASIQAAHM